MRNILRALPALALVVATACETDPRANQERGEISGRVTGALTGEAVGDCYRMTAVDDNTVVCDMPAVSGGPTDLKLYKLEADGWKNKGVIPGSEGYGLPAASASNKLRVGKKSGPDLTLDDCDFVGGALANCVGTGKKVVSPVSSATFIDGLYYTVDGAGVMRRLNADGTWAKVTVSGCDDVESGGNLDIASVISAPDGSIGGVCNDLLKASDFVVDIEQKGDGSLAVIPGSNAKGPCGEGKMTAVANVASGDWTLSACGDLKFHPTFTGTVTPPPDTTGGDTGPDAGGDEDVTGGEDVLPVEVDAEADNGTIPGEDADATTGDEDGDVGYPDAEEADQGGNAGADTDTTGDDAAEDAQGEDTAVDAQAADAEGDGTNPLPDADESDGGSNPIDTSGGDGTGPLPDGNEPDNGPNPTDTSAADGEEDVTGIPGATCDEVEKVEGPCEPVQMDGECGFVSIQEGVNGQCVAILKGSKGKIVFSVPVDGEYGRVGMQPLGGNGSVGMTGRVGSVGQKATLSGVEQGMLGDPDGYRAYIKGVGGVLDGASVAVENPDPTKNPNAQIAAKVSAGVRAAIAQLYDVDGNFCGTVDLGAGESTTVAVGDCAPVKPPKVDAGGTENPGGGSGDGGCSAARGHQSLPDGALLLAALSGLAMSAFRRIFRRKQTATVSK